MYIGGEKRSVSRKKVFRRINIHLWVEWLQNRETTFMKYIYIFFFIINYLRITHGAVTSRVHVCDDNSYQRKKYFNSVLIIRKIKIVAMFSKELFCSGRRQK